MMIEGNTHKLNNVDILDYNSETGFTFVPDMIVVLGRGIERGRSGNWRPTRLVEKGLGPRFSHTGETDWSVNGLGDDHVIGGGNANVIATQKYIIDLFKINDNKFPRLLFAAGQPDYLSSFNITEGAVMRDKLCHILPPVVSSGINIEVLERNKNTFDDINESLRIALNENMRSLAFITVQPHIERCMAMMFGIISQNVDMQHQFSKIVFVDSFKMLSGINSKAGARYAKIFGRLRETSAYSRTVELEKRGVKALRDGNY